MNKRWPLNTENYAEKSHEYKHKNFMVLVLSVFSISIVITDQFYFFGQENNSCHIVSLIMKLL